MAAPSSAYVNAPARVMSPPTTQATKIMPEEGRDWAMIPVVRNIPDPITIPTIIIVESNTPSCLIKPWLFSGIESFIVKTHPFCPFRS